MTTEEFIKKWRYSRNHLGFPSVGIHVGWDIIPVNSRVESFSGKEAWDKIYNCTPPWFKTIQAFSNLVNTKNADYLQIVQEETDNGKITYYRQNGLKEPFFCAFANQEGSFILLGDGNHRFLDCLHLIHDQGHNLDEDLKRTELEIIYLSNFDEVMRPDNIWDTWPESL